MPTKHSLSINAHQATNPNRCPPPTTTPNNKCIQFPINDKNSNKSPLAIVSKCCLLGYEVEAAGRGGARASKGLEEVGGRAVRGGGLTS